jgi:lipopolysaccharide/colanic/teichoic acid biosynthesis glycosyltransferase
VSSQNILEGRADSPNTFVRQNTAKRGVKPSIFDRAFALIVLAVSLPFTLALASLIALGGQRPLFLQERVGYKGKIFLIFKFRTIPDGGWDAAEEKAKGSVIARAQLSLFKLISTVVRSRGIDEFPQFANILRGDMQVFGPRPLMEKDFKELPERRLERCAVLPGITGLAQINGGQSLDSASKLALDLYVIDHASPRLSAKIVWRTVLRIIGGKAATDNASAADLVRAKRHMASTGTGATAVKIPSRSRRERQQSTIAAKGLIPASNRTAKALLFGTAPASFKTFSGDRAMELDGGSQSVH